MAVQGWPTGLLSGEMGLYSCKNFETNEVVLVPRQCWAPANSVADLNGKGYALLQPVILDQLGRTRLFALQGAAWVLLTDWLVESCEYHCNFFPTSIVWIDYGP